MVSPKDGYEETWKKKESISIVLARGDSPKWTAQLHLVRSVTRTLDDVDGNGEMARHSEQLPWRRARKGRAEASPWQ